MLCAISCTVGIGGGKVCAKAIDGLKKAVEVDIKNNVALKSEVICVTLVEHSQYSPADIARPELEAGLPLPSAHRSEESITSHILNSMFKCQRGR